ncbi:hypothetical protein EYF80_031787 [Liparis tanakae]|uniref:Uncharacterized protein n=1 Tax=Liparis tanakae TaxID=230148 RepID=A0A4Z2GYV9_9TELE|nr:hypothetical protein EYF80_031787 [Liparis tanakae]
MSRSQRKASRRGCGLHSDLRGSSADVCWLSTPLLSFSPLRALQPKRPQSFRLFLMMTSVTASNTNCTFLVSVAQVLKFGLDVRLGLVVLVRA